MRATLIATVLLLAGCAAAAPPTVSAPVPPTAVAERGPTLEQAIAGSHRSQLNRGRDRYRHPLETLEFFGIEDDMTVIEVWPGGAGWYTEILAPFLRSRGQYIAAAPNGSPYQQKGMASLRAKLAAAPQLYDRADVVELGPPKSWQPVAPGSVDMVLTFRNVHNWVEAGYHREMFASFYRSLKSGGVLGIVEHRAEPDWSIEEMLESGYMTQDYVIKLGEEAGFRFVAWEEINANPKDRKGYAEGVWTLPPTLRLGEKNRDAYIAIGESDRMTLRFVKP